MKAAFYTLGCKVNQYESQAMAQRLERMGFVICDPTEEADVYIINSCTVTAESDRKTRQTVRRFRKLHPDSLVLLTGCMPQAFPQESAELDSADIVIGNKSNHLIYDYIMQFINGSGRIVAVEQHESGEPFKGDTISEFRERTRANVKIEDGCNRFCSYCIIPYARGRVRSKPLETLKAEIALLEKSGFSEIVLVGINLSAYGTDIGSSLAEAVETVASFDGVKRIRLGSLEPDHITDDVISRLSAVEKFCPQFHISLQSGCDKTLKKMNRHYSSGEYYELCMKLRKNFEGATLTTDVMVGFPDETSEDFAQSLEFVRKVGFEKVHVFPYSRRAGTPAARMANQVENAEKSRRAAIMIEETEKIRKAFLELQIGKVLEVLPEEFHDGFVQGYTANYTPVRIMGADKLKEIIKAEIIAVEDDFCIGKAI
ncbi:MAG: tRNA (N(6)-L-threonylcarbamoyladenosine(37)-C(2))-methylthiotransferase MtaB [Clostridia bacterium]|nr:tRNA (N(6)-L-threonylcarbamoyladenosine(37)-C(2))-methylthiotransferase MtaB [Clostridia bacterium]